MTTEPQEKGIDVAQKDLIQESISEAIKAQKGSLPPWLLAIGIFASVGGSYFKNQSDLEYMKKEMDTQCKKISIMEVKIYDQQNSYIRLDEKMLGVQNQLSEIKIMLKEAIDKKYIN